MSAARAGLATVALVGIGTDLLAVRDGIFGILGERPCPMRAWPANAPRGDPIVTMRREPRELRRCSVPGAFVRSAMVPAAREGVAIVRAYNALCPRDRRTDVVRAAGFLRRARVPADVTEIRVPRDYGRKSGLFGVGEPSYRGESWLGSGEGKVVVSARSMNRQTVEVDTSGPARVVLNQNWDPGWRADRGRLASDGAGRLVIELDRATRAALHLEYRPPYWEEGLLCAGLGLAGVGLALFWDRRSRSAPGGRERARPSPLAAPGPRG